MRSGKDGSIAVCGLKQLNRVRFNVRVVASLLPITTWPISLVQNGGPWKALNSFLKRLLGQTRVAFIRLGGCQTCNTFGSLGFSCTARAYVCSASFTLPSLNCANAFRRCAR